MEWPRKLGKHVRQHKLLCTNAADVIGRERMLEVRLNRALDDVDRLTASARQSLMSADEAMANNDHIGAEQHNREAERTAAQLVDAEQRVEDLQELHHKFWELAQQARDEVEESAIALSKKMDEHQRTELSQAAKRWNQRRGWRSETRNIKND